jgi:predicted ATP-dependent serine protease
MTYFVCSHCGRDVDSRRDQCPYCKANHSLIPQTLGTELEEDIFDSSDYGYEDNEPNF